MSLFLLFMSSGLDCALSVSHPVSEENKARESVISQVKYRKRAMYILHEPFQATFSFFITRKYISQYVNKFSTFFKNLLACNVYIILTTTDNNIFCYGFCFLTLINAPNNIFSIFRFSFCSIYRQRSVTILLYIYI